MLDLSRQYEKLKPEIDSAMAEVLASTRFILGPNVYELEKNVAQFSRVSQGIGVANGSDALHLALLACGVQPGDEVIVPAFTFFATAGAVSRIGAIPVFVDIDEETYLIDVQQIEEALTKRTKAIIPVHLYGQMADMEEICRIAKENDLYVIEDAAQSMGATYKGKTCGELGAAACYSFFPTKNLGAFGDAGMVVTDDNELADHVRMLRVHGSRPKYVHHTIGYNSRLDELQAAILNVKIKYLPEWNQKRKERARTYNELFQSLLPEQVQVPYIKEDRDHIFHQYTIRVDKRDALQTFLKEQGVATMIYYPKPLHLQPVYRELGYQEGDLPQAEKACSEVLSLPMFPELTEQEQEYVVQKIEQFFKNG